MTASTSELAALRSKVVASGRLLVELGKSLVLDEAASVLDMTSVATVEAVSVVLERMVEVSEDDGLQGPAAVPLKSDVAATKP